MEFEICKGCPITDKDECVKAFGSFACQKILVSNIVEKGLVDYDKFEEIVYVCDKCGETLRVNIESEFAKIPFEASWSCKCGNFIKVKWNGKELEYL